MLSERLIRRFCVAAGTLRSLRALFPGFDVAGVFGRGVVGFIKNWRSFSELSESVSSGSNSGLTEDVGREVLDNP